MIKTVVFDIGEVLIGFEWNDYVRSLFDEETADKVTHAMFGSRYWHELDRAVLSEEEILELFYSIEPEYKAEIERLRHQKDIIDAIKELENRIAKSKSSALELDGNPIEACVSQMDKNILQSDIYKKIINCTMSIRKGDVTMTNDDWKEFERVFDHDNPLFKTVIGSKLNGSVMEYRICMLAKLGLSAASINKIIGNEYKNMTVLKKRLYKKIGYVSLSD